MGASSSFADITSGGKYIVNTVPSTTDPKVTQIVIDKTPTQTKAHKFRIRYYINLDASFSPRIRGSEVLKLSVGDHDIVKSSSGGVIHTFGVRILAGDFI